MNNLIKRVWTRKELVFVEDLRGMAFTNEDGAHTFSIAGKDENGTDLALSGTVAGSLIRPDGTTTAMTGTIADGCANLTLSPECYGVSGRASLTIFLTSGGQKTAIYHAVMSIGKSSTSQVSPGVAADVVDLVNRIDTATASIPATYTALLGSIASDYSSSKTYKAGNYVWYGGYLYKANQDIDTAESWTSGHWTKAVLADDFRSEITDLKSAVENVDDFIGNAYTWMDGYWALGNGVWTAQTGTVTYHSTDKIIGTIPALTDFFNGDYMSGDSFLPVWLGSTYLGYLMDGVWKRPNGSAYATPPRYDRYAIVLHNVADYENFRLRNLALVSEMEAVDVVAEKADACSSLLVDIKNVTNTADQSVQTFNLYFYAVTKKVYLKEYTPPEFSSGTVYVYLQKLNNAGSYDTVKSKQLTPGETFYVDMIVDTDYAIILTFNTDSPINQYFATVNNDDTFAMVQGWNGNTHKPVSTTLQYYIPGTYVVYDPVTNYLLPYIDDGDPCNWKGTECSLFDNPLCIGDSITQGAPTPPDITPDPSKATRTVVNKTMYSYPASMKKQFGVECTNWGRSGISSQGWYDYYSVNEPSWSGHDAAIMLIGNNDYHLVDDLGGLNSETLPTAIQRSKAAMMSIITKLKADNADIKIFICTLLPGWDMGNSLSPYVCDNIRDIASTEDNVYLIDLSRYSAVKNGPYSYGHPTALGYNQLAREIGGAIGYIIHNNPEEFKWVQFIGTEYAMDGR